MIETFIKIAVMQLVVVMLPGPDFALILKNTLLHHKKRALLTAFGIALGMTTVAAICVSSVN
ncbi:MAG: hypothetical protein GY782_05535 [Gammaproteobacteria bacterium]|nr:hypothetical protein [Gammaproteobacteria bacterium]